MLMRLSLLRTYMEAKLGQRGAMFVEYALILAFIVIVGVVFIGDSGLADNIKSIIGKVQGLVSKADSAAPAQS